jgi:uncharacterized damage-inducible protein DinB
METSLRAAVTGLEDRSLETPEAPGKWSVLQVVQHLADTELVVYGRNRIMAAEDDPMLVVFDQDRWVALREATDSTLDESLSEFAQLRALHLEFLRRLPQEAWTHPGRHPERGPTTIEATVRLHAAHDLYHLAQIERIKQALG